MLASGPCSASKGAIGERLDRALPGKARLHMRDVLRFAGGVDDDEQVVVKARDHEIIENATGVIGEQRIALLAGLEPDDVDRHERLQRHCGTATNELHLPHMRDVEKAGLRTRVLMLLQHAHRILHRHFVTGEGHHLGAELDVKVIQRGTEKGRGAHSDGSRNGVPEYG